MLHNNFLLFILASFLTLAGCDSVLDGASTDSGPRPDGAEGDGTAGDGTAGDGTAGDGTAGDGTVKTDHSPSDVIVTPGDGAMGVNVHASVVLVFFKDLDQASLDHTTVKLRYPEYMNSLNPPPMERQALPCRLIYSKADQTLEIDPLGALAYGITYWVEIAGLKYASGEDVASLSTRFTTQRNPQTKKYINYPTHITPMCDTRTINSEGLMTQAVRSLAGPDGKLCTADDVVIHYSTHTLNGGLYIRSVDIEDPGIDQVWFTADDPVMRYREYRLHTDGCLEMVISYNAPGSDNIWFTSDDQVDRFSKWTLDQRNLISKVDFDGPGLDLTWFTGDDKVIKQNDYTYDDRGISITRHTVDYSSQETPYEKRYVYTLNADGQQEQRNIYRYPGPDQQWKTADDVIWSYDVVSYTSTGAVDKDVSYNSSGEDQEWFTPDDKISGLLSYTYDARGNCTRYIHYDGPGMDQTWSTADDRIRYYESTTYDQDDNRIESAQYNGPGSDHTWLTADDTMGIMSTYSP